MVRLIRMLIAFSTLCSASVAVSAGGRLSPAQEQRLSGLFRQSEHFDHDGEVVKAYLSLREAQRLQQLWTSNVDGDEAVSMQRMNRFVASLIRRDDASVIRILHSKQVALGDKLSLLHVLEQDILLNYPGAHSDGLLFGSDE